MSHNTIRIFYDFLTNVSPLLDILMENQLSENLRQQFAKNTITTDGIEERERNQSVFLL